jgi:hypothetical protein
MSRRGRESKGCQGGKGLTDRFQLSDQVSYPENKYNPCHKLLLSIYIYSWISARLYLLQSVSNHFRRQEPRGRRLGGKAGHTPQKQMSIPYSLAPITKATTSLQIPYIISSYYYGG